MGQSTLLSSTSHSSDPTPNTFNMKAMFIVLLAVCAMAVAEEAVDQSADEQFFHTYGYYPTAYHYTAPVAVKTVAPTVKTVQYAAPYAYQYGAYPYAAAYQPYAVKSLLPATYGAYPYGAYPYGAYPYGYAVAAEEEKKEE